MSTVKDKPFISLAETADLLGVSKTYVNRMCHEQRLEAYQSGGIWFIRRSSAELFKDELKGNAGKKV